MNIDDVQSVISKLRGFEYLGLRDNYYSAIHVWELVEIPGVYFMFNAGDMFGSVELNISFWRLNFNDCPRRRVDKFYFGKDIKFQEVMELQMSDNLRDELFFNLDIFTWRPRYSDESS